jgi:hypothetical protein
MTVAKGYEIVRRGRRRLAVFEFDADECDGVAGYVPHTDAWQADLLAAADELRALDEEA